MPEHETETTRMKPLNRLMSIFVSPVELMKNIKVYPAVLVPLILCVLISLATLPLLMRYSDIQTRALSLISLERYGVDYFNILTAVDEDETIVAQTTVDTITLATNIVTAVLTPALYSFFAALGLFILTKIARGKVQLKQYFSMYVHLYVITAIGILVMTALGVALNTTLDVTSLAAAFMPLGNITMLVFNVLSSISLFNVWVTVLTVIGVRVINDFTWKRAVIIVFAAFAFSVAFSAVSMSATFFTFDMLSGIDFSTGF
jgi:hypothetical protein